MRNLKSTKVFISAARPNQTLTETALAHDGLRIALESSSHLEAVREVAGCFDGNLEPAFCVFVRPGHILEAIDACVIFASAWDQESVLVVHGDDAAELCETETDCSAIIGTFTRLPDGVKPEPGEDYTLADSIYYVVR